MPTRASPDVEGRLAAELLVSIGEGVVVVDGDRRIVWLNPACERILGVSAARAEGALLAELFARSPELVRLIDHTLAIEGSAANRHVGIERPLGDRVVASVTSAPWVDAGGRVRGAVTVLRDRTPAEAIEEETRRGDRKAMAEAFGLGLAHEIRNPLGGIRGAAQLLERRAASGRPIDDCLGVIVHEVDRLDQLVRAVLELGHSGPGPRERLNVHRALDEVLAVVRADPAFPLVSFVCKYDPSLPEIDADPGGLHRVFLNLIRNACEAVGSSGEVVLTTSVSREFTRVLAGRAAGRFLRVEIADDGLGIPDDVRERIFTPLFTTKSGGTGLGLPLALKIVEDHGGLLRCRPRPPRGSVFEVYLPLPEAPPRAVS